MSDTQLAGTSVLVTRPEHQSSELVAAIEAAGGRVISFPVIEIQARGKDDVDADASKLPSPDITIFVSRNAVRHGLPWSAGSIAAVGPSTAAAIERAGHTVHVRPANGYDSESLLEEPELQDVAGKSVRIVRGTGGRQLLGDTLRSRGASVDYLEVYARAVPDYPPGAVDRLERRLRSGDVDVVTVMSVESLCNLIALLPEACRPVLAAIPLVTPAARVIKEALDRLPGCPTMLATGPGADEMVRAIAALGLHAPGHNS